MLRQSDRVSKLPVLVRVRRAMEVTNSAVPSAKKRARLAPRRVSKYRPSGKDHVQSADQELVTNQLAGYVVLLNRSSL